MLLCGWWERQQRWERQICFCALRFRSIEAYHSRVDALQKDGMLYKNMHEAIDGDQIVEFFFRQSVDVAKEIVSCSTSSKHCTWAFTPTFEPTSGEKEPTGNSWWCAGLS